MKIALQQVQQNIGEIANRHEYTADVIYELLAAYGRSKSAITQLREGHLNKAEDAGAVLQKDVVYFKTFAAGASLEHEVSELYEDPLTQRYNPRYLIATDLTNLAAKDSLKGTTLTIKLADIDDHLDFFYGWTGDEVVDTKTEAVADRRAADKMNELYVEIEKRNRAEFASNPNFRHELNVFFTRLLFCFFAEDTGIYTDKQFTDAIKTYTQTDGSDLAWFFGELFGALDTKPEDNGSLKTPFKEFPYVNGSIFNTSKHAIAIPKFSAQARHLVLECGRQDWGKINPDIFGVMFQGIVDPERRDENGMDYTSIPNIMKVIQPLFLDSLDEEYDKYFDNEKKLWVLLARVQKIKVFDPACGSGNFLIIAYKELRKLQHKIIARIDQLRPAGLNAGLPDNQLININNFYGIEIDDFAHELAVLSLFLAKHQMNQEFTEQFGKALSIIPLIDIPTIVRGNAARLDWQEVCPNVGHTVRASEQSTLFEFEGEQTELKLGETTYDEIYLIGNPPYKGSSLQSKNQKADMRHNYEKILDNYKNLDYISIWFKKGADYIASSKAQLAFVSTNSICQGEQVNMIWPYLLGTTEIGFAYTSFKWQNSARDNAGVTVVVISLRNVSKAEKVIVTGGIEYQAKNISPYLTDSQNIFFPRYTASISGFPDLVRGSMPTDGGAFTLTEAEKNDLLASNPEARELIKGYTSGGDFLASRVRWCLWIEDSQLQLAESIPFVRGRLERVRDFRLESDAPTTVDYARYPNRFRQKAYKDTNFVILPLTSSERREYIPMDFLQKGIVATNSAGVIYDAEPWLFALLQSKMHMAWIRTVCGKLKTDYRYSSTLGYNTFPIRTLLEAEKDALNKSARRILLARAAHPGKTLADMYDPDKMPANLRAAHEENDHLVDNLYKKGGFTNDEDRLSALFDLYERMTAKEKAK